MLSIKYSTILNQNIQSTQEATANEILKKKKRNTRVKQNSKTNLKTSKTIKKQRTVIRSREKIIIEQEQPNEYLFEQEKTKQKKKAIT